MIAAIVYCQSLLPQAVSDYIGLLPCHESMSFGEYHL